MFSSALSLGLKLLRVSSFLQQPDSMHGKPYHSSNDTMGFIGHWELGHVPETSECTDNRNTWGYHYKNQLQVVQSYTF